MEAPLTEQAFIARATTYGGWFGVVVGAVVGVQLGVTLLGITAAGGIGLFAGRVIVRGIAVLGWGLLSAQSADQIADYDDAPPERPG
jgi:hypothetical protein